MTVTGQGSLSSPLGTAPLVAKGPGSESAEITNPGRKNVWNLGNNGEVASECEGGMGWEREPKAPMLIKQP